MKRQILSLLLCFAFLMADSSAQLTFTGAIESKANVYSLTAQTEGTLLTVSTTDGFAWVLPDDLGSDNTYATLLCVSDGSFVDFGPAPSSTNTYPDNFSQASQIMPLVGNNFPSLTSDSYSAYYPSKPPAASKTVSGVVTTIKNPWRLRSEDGMVTLKNMATNVGLDDASTVGFEILNCGTAIWCLQTQTEYNNSPGSCDGSSTLPTCTAPTCSTLATKTSCTDSSSLIFQDSFCVTGCEATSVTLKSGNSACEACESPCAGCSGSVDTCTSCIADNYLFENSCVFPCPAGYVEDSNTGKCVEEVALVESSSFAAWKLSLIIALPIVAILGAVTGYVYFAKKKRSAAYLEKNTKDFMPLTANSPASVTVSTLRNEV